MIKKDPIYVFDNKRELLRLIKPNDIFASEQTSELDGKITHVFEAVYYDDLEDAEYFGMQDYEDRELFHMYKVINMDVNDEVFQMNGIHILFDDLKGRGGVIVDRRPTNEHVADALSSILEGTGWEIGDIDTSNVITTSWYYMERLDAFWDLLEKGNVEFEVNIKYERNQIVSQTVSLKDRISGDYGKWFEYGHKLLSVRKEVKKSSVYTAFIGRGRGVENEDGEFGRRLLFTDVVWNTAFGDPVNKPLGQDYVEIPEATERHGYPDGAPRIGVVEFTDVTDPEQLLRLTHKHALEESRPKIHFSADIMDTENLELGETVAIIKDKPRIRYKTRVFKIKRDFIRKKAKNVEFGDKLVYTEAERIKEQEKERDELRDTLRSDIGSGQRGDYVNVVRHGNISDIPRPEGAKTVHWQGEARPSESVSAEFDIWFEPVVLKDRVFRIGSRSTLSDFDNLMMINATWDNLQHIKMTTLPAPGDEYNTTDYTFANLQWLDHMKDLSLEHSYSARGMFQNSQSLRTVEIFNMQNIADVRNMFDNCIYLSSLSLGNLGVQYVEDIDKRTLDITGSNNIFASGLRELADSLGISTSGWILKYIDRADFDKTLLTRKGWVPMPMVRGDGN